MKKIYVIRSIAYHYSDEYHYIHTPGGIKEVFSDHGSAISELLNLERKMFKNFDLGDIDILSPISNTPKSQNKELYDLLISLFDVDKVKVDSNDSIYCVRNTFLPIGISDQELITLRELSGIKFYELSEHGNSVKFYGVFIKSKEEYLKYINEAPYFFSSREQLMGSL